MELLKELFQELTKEFMDNANHFDGEEWHRACCQLMFLSEIEKEFRQLKQENNKLKSQNKKSIVQMKKLKSQLKVMKQKKKSLGIEYATWWKNQAFITGEVSPKSTFSHRNL